MGTRAADPLRLFRKDNSNLSAKVIIHSFMTSKVEIKTSIKMPNHNWTFKWTAHPFSKTPSTESWPSSRRTRSPRGHFLFNSRHRSTGLWTTPPPLWTKRCPHQDRCLDKVMPKWDTATAETTTPWSWPLELLRSLIRTWRTTCSLDNKKSSKTFTSTSKTSYQANKTPATYLHRPIKRGKRRFKMSSTRRPIKVRSSRRIEWLTTLMPKRTRIWLMLRNVLPK